METHLPSTPALPPPTLIPALGLQPHLREVLFDDLQGGSHAASSTQNYLNIMENQVFRKQRGGNQMAEWGLEPAPAPPHVTIPKSPSRKTPLPSPALELLLSAIPGSKWSLVRSRACWETSNRLLNVSCGERDGDSRSEAVVVAGKSGVRGTGHWRKERWV